MSKYDDLSREQLIELLKKRDRTKRLGLVWERDEIEADNAVDANFVAATIIPDLSDKPAPWRNMVIEGDNYDALRWLRMTMAGQVKCIYIDPPYNTGAKDWVYNDHYANPEDAYFHSTWLEFLFRRLTLARDLMAEDGVILVSINDDQRAKLELLMDEVMPGMRVGSFAWRTRTGGNEGGEHYFSMNHEHVLVCAKTRFAFAGHAKSYANYTNPDGDPRGDWTAGDLTQSKTRLERPNGYYPLENPANGIVYPCNPERVWVYVQGDGEKAAKLRTKTMREFIEEGRILFPSDEKFIVCNSLKELKERIEAGSVPASNGIPMIRLTDSNLEFWVGKKIGFGTPKFKRFAKDLQRDAKPTSSWIMSNGEWKGSLESSKSLTAGLNTEATKELRSIFGTQVFSYPKPVSLIRELVRQSTGPGDLVLDFFAGSATTAQAVMELNAEDGGDRRFIMVSSTEATREEPDKNLCRDVTAERIRRLNASTDPKFADLAADFAYLRCREIEFEDLDQDLAPEEVWAALEALHRLPLTRYTQAPRAQDRDADADLCGSGGRGVAGPSARRGVAARECLRLCLGPRADHGRPWRWVGCAVGAGRVGGEVPAMSGGEDIRLSLAGYQQKAVDAMAETLRTVSALHEREPDHRERIARELGVILLQAPTGSGKTLMLGRALEAVRGQLGARTVWFWFAPYAGLVTQTRSALTAQCGALRQRDVYADREAGAARDGDVFVQTWASVAVVKKESRKVRSDKEAALSVDSMIEELRERGFRIGVVIDEAHLNFGSGAAATADFFLNVLSPDFTVLATATPNDAKLEKFERDAGLKVASRVTVARDAVVKAGLNKIGLMVGVLRFKDEDRALIDTEVATLTAGWSQHCFIKDRLAELGIAVTPLMLVQVEDQEEGKQDPVTRVKERLAEIGVPEKAIAVHTSGEPDPAFHTLAYDPEIEVLIFKLAVATGFDAPRAWTLVSVRPSRGKEFGLQIVGRIMRVHPLVRHLHGEEALLDRGYVFLSDPEVQVGLDEAAADLKAVREGIAVLTDRLDVTVLGNDARAAERYGVRLSVPPVSQNAASGGEAERAARQVAMGLLNTSYADASVFRQQSASYAASVFLDPPEPMLFPDLPDVLSPRVAAAQVVPAEHQVKYPLRTDLGLPAALVREELPNLFDIEGDLCPQIAREFCRMVPMTSLLLAVNSNAELSMRDLFNAGQTDQRNLAVRMSAARIAEQAQAQLMFNDGIDPRRIREAVGAELARLCQRDGIAATTRDIRRTINLAILRQPQALKDAVRIAQGHHIRLESNEPIPAEQFWTADAAPSKKGAYGAFIGRFNRPERAFAEMLDNDDTGRVKWWLRNPENEKWATRLILPTGKRFFPDFVVGISGRRTRDSIALVEIKDDGETGRLQSDSNSIKIRTEHSEYKKVFWSFREAEGVFLKAVWHQSHNRIFSAGPFEIEDMVLIQ